MEKLSKDFKFKKQFGQNFIFDKNFLKSIVDLSKIDKNSNILEIGAGAGTLSEILAKTFKKVISFEIDKTLTEHLLAIQNENKNLNFVFCDVLEKQTSEIDGLFDGNYSIVANLPYYITSQIVFKFLMESKKLDSLYVMVQKEVGLRYSAKPSTKDYGIPTVLLDTFGCCKIVKEVSRKMFVPQPNVDSCMLKIDLTKDKFDIKNPKKYAKFIDKCFQMKRKTLYNNLSKAGFEKQKVVENILKLNLVETVRPENLTPSQFVDLYKNLEEDV